MQVKERMDTPLGRGLRKPVRASVLSGHVPRVPLTATITACRCFTQAAVATFSRVRCAAGSTHQACSALP